MQLEVAGTFLPEGRNIQDAAEVASRIGQGRVPGEAQMAHTVADCQAVKVAKSLS